MDTCEKAIRNPQNRRIQMTTKDNSQEIECDTGTPKAYPSQSRGLWQPLTAADTREPVKREAPPRAAESRVPNAPSEAENSHQQPQRRLLRETATSQNAIRRNSDGDRGS